MRLVKASFLSKSVYYAAVNHSTPSNLSYAWNFGSLAFICLAIQIVSGIFLAMHYTPHMDMAFLSVEHIMRDVQGGWLLRYLHANGASMFFVIVFLHIFRGLYYTSYVWPRQFVWVFGVLLLLLMIITAFLGYVLPWGQMSFWGATVITNLVTAVPIVGDDIVLWLWGGYSISNATLNRFFSLHYLLPFVILGVSVIHVILLQYHSSNNPYGIPFTVDIIPFSPYYLIKDIWGFVLFFAFYSFFLFYAPNMLNHPDNYIKANPLVTPDHIVPEWYFLPFYAILRAVPSKLFGVLAMVLAIILLAFLPFISQTDIRSIRFRPFSKVLFYFIVADAALLGWVGGKVAAYPYVQIGQVAAFFYFFYFLVLSPIFDIIENWLQQPYKDLDLYFK
jgi:quinol-cytochrome oxidoreductase complex cytochrome b subunit